MKYDYAGVVERMERLRAPLDYAWGVMTHLKNVNDSGPMRDAYQELQVGVQTVQTDRAIKKKKLLCFLSFCVNLLSYISIFNFCRIRGLAAGMID